MTKTEIPCKEVRTKAVQVERCTNMRRKEHSEMGVPFFLACSVGMVCALCCIVMSL